MKAIRFAVWGTAGLLFLVHTAVVITHTSLAFTKGSALGSAAAYWTLLLLAGIILGAGLRKGRLPRSNRFLMVNAALIALMGAGTVWLATDIPAITHDYSETDMACPVNGSYEFLKVFSSDHPPDLPTDIALAWDHIGEWRNAIDALDRFDRICDLPEAATFTVKTPMLKIRALRDAADIYGRYFLAELEAGQPDHATEDFCRLNRVARKGLNQATLLFHKLLFASVVEKTMEAAFAALQNETMDPRTLTALHADFTSIPYDEISLVRPLTSEYLIMKNTLTGLKPENLMAPVIMEPGKALEELPHNSLWSRVVYTMGFKPNQSVADMKIFYDLMIDAHRHYPVDMTQADAYMDDYAKHPPIRNMVGWILNSIAMPDLSRFVDRLVAIKIKSDLLALTLNQKLDRTVIMTDFYTGEALTYQEKNALIRHPGKDGEYDTPDDVVLGEKK